MDYKEVLRLQAVEVNDLLTAYIKIHNNILKRQGTFSSLFRRIDFEKIYNDTIKLSNNFSSKLDELKSFGAENFGSLDETQKRYLECLIRYMEKLFITVELLKQRQKLLYEKSKGKNYKYKEYKQIKKFYQNSIERYLEIGKELNELSYIIGSVNMFSLADTFTLLTHSVGNLTINQVLQKCRDIGLDEYPYIDLGMDSSLPEFDNGYLFKYKTDDNIEVLLDILEKEKKILQAGIQIIYPRKLFISKIGKHYKKLTDMAEDYYDTGSPMNLGNIKILNYGNNQTVCYISQSKVNKRNILTLRVGNTVFWG